MTTVLLVKQDWDDAYGGTNTIGGIINHMASPAVMRRTGEPFPAGANLCVRWGCTANIPINNVVNPAAAIHLAADKPKFRKFLREQAPTIIPTSWFDDDGLVALHNIGTQYPVVVRPNRHARGEHFYLCNNTEQLMQAIATVDGRYYISKFYNKEKEFRVIVVQGRVAVVIEKIPNNRALPAWGRAAGWRRVRWGQWPIDMVKKAIEAWSRTGLHIGAVDVILDSNGNYYVCEVNSAPEMGDGEQQRIAWCLDYIVENGRNTIPVGGNGSVWRHFIHPAISEEAVV